MECPSTGWKTLRVISVKGHLITLALLVSVTAGNELSRGLGGIVGVTSSHEIQQEFVSDKDRSR